MVGGQAEAEFRQRFGTMGACRAALFQLRWGKGWACPGCGHGGHAELKGRAAYQCNRYKIDSATVDGRPDRRDGVPLDQAAAWLLKHKLMAAMEQREAGKPRLEGWVEVDDAYLGGQRPGGKRGRGAAGKTPFVAAVETTPERKPRRLRLTVVEGFRKREIEALAKRDLAPGSNVVSDGLSCWTAVAAAGCDHFPMVTGSGAQTAKWLPFTWVNTALGNIKTALAGTYQHVSATAPHPYRVIIAG